MKFLFYISLIFTLSLSSSISSMKIYTRDSLTQVDEEEDTYELLIKGKAEFAIELTSNPSTGYEWILANEKNLEILSTNSTNGEGLYIEPVVPIETTGKPGKQRFFFTPKETGSQFIKLEYKRPWTSMAASQLNIIVKVK